MLLLFDIDLTLIDSAGSGREAMNLAFEALYGVGGAFDDVAFAGRTDMELLRDAMRRHGLPFEDVVPAMRAFLEAYAPHLAALLPLRPGRVLPGVLPMLETLSSRPDICIGLATGNARTGAALKLGHFGLAGYLAEGGFGDDDVDRARVVAIGARRFGVDGVGPRQRTVVVVGDTPRDVAAARANGFRSAAVATGFHNAPTLVDAGADLVLSDFSDHERAIEAMLSLGESGMAGAG